MAQERLRQPEKPEGGGVPGTSLERTRETPASAALPVLPRGAPSERPQRVFGHIQATGVGRTDSPLRRSLGHSW